MSHELIGAPVLSGISSRGFISRVLDAPARVFTLSSGRMEPVRNEFEIVWESGRVDTAPDNLAREWLEAAQRANLPAIDDVEARKAARLSPSNL